MIPFQRFDMDLSSLEKELAPLGRILVDTATKEFQEYLVRWSDVDKRVPSAIVIVKDEAHAQKAV